MKSTCPLHADGREAGEAWSFGRRAFYRRKTFTASVRKTARHGAQRGERHGRDFGEASLPQTGTGEHLNGEEREEGRRRSLGNPGSSRAQGEREVCTWLRSPSPGACLVLALHIAERNSALCTTAAL
jgi:hypothetical protein